MTAVSITGFSVRYRRGASCDGDVGCQSMKRMIHSLVAVVLYASSAVGVADTIEQTFEFDCDVPAGKVSDWIGSIVPRVQHVKGSVELLEPRDHERWWPLASVFLLEGTQQVGLQLFRDRQQPEKLQVAALRPQSEGGRSVLTSVPWEGLPIEFALSVTESGEVELTVADKATLLGVNKIDVERLALSCSTAQFKFKNVVVRSERSQQSIAADRAGDLAPPER